jgi:RHS repeat-associated protein
VPNYSYNPSNELTSNSMGSYTYDANGNTLSDAQGRSFTWDFENRLTQVVTTGTNAGTTTFKYDPFGRRIQKSGPLGTTNYLYDGPNLLQETDNTGNTVGRYTQGTNLDEELSELRSGTTSYYHADALGSVTSLSNPAGALANTYAYDSFGKSVATTGPLTNPFQYTGREFDAETGLYYDRARYYDTISGRFISEDPIGFSGSGLNFYGYVENNPVLWADPLGLCPNTAEQEACRWRVAMWHLKREMEINNETDKKLLDEIFSWENIIGFSAPKVAEPIIEHYGWELAKKFLPPVELAHMGELSYKLWLISDEGMNEKHDLDVLFKTLLYQCDH